MHHAHDRTHTRAHAHVRVEFINFVCLFFQFILIVPNHSPYCRHGNIWHGGGRGAHIILSELVLMYFSLAYVVHQVYVCNICRYRNFQVIAWHFVIRKNHGVHQTSYCV